MVVNTKKPTTPAGTAGTTTNTTEDTSPLSQTPPAPAPEPTANSLTVAAPEDLTPAEADAFDEMNPALKDMALQMRDLMVDELTNLLDSRYKLGGLVLEIKKNPQTYGAMGDIQLAKFFGESSKTMYNEARRIRERYSPEEYERIKNAINPQNGARISYKHLAVLLRIEDNKLAGKMLDACFQAGWSTKELSHHVGKKLVDMSKKTGGDRKVRAATFLGMIENYTSVTEGWVEQYTDVWEEGRAWLAAFDKIPEEKIDTALVTRLKKARAQAEEFEETQSFVLKEFNKYIDRAEEVIRKRKRGAAQARPSEADDAKGDEGEDE
jgi:hypothetical protein